MGNLKEYLREAAEHYERHAEHERKAAERYPGGKLHTELMEAYQFNRGRAVAMREALDLIAETIG